MNKGLKSDHKLNLTQVNRITDDLAPSVCFVSSPSCSGTGFVLGKIRNNQTSSYNYCLLTNYHLNIEQAIQNGGTSQAVFGFLNEQQRVSLQQGLNLIKQAQQQELQLQQQLTQNNSPQLQQQLQDQKQQQQQIRQQLEQRHSLLTVNILPHVIAASADMDYILLILEPSLQLDNRLQNKPTLANMIHKIRNTNQPVKPVKNEPLFIIGHAESRELRLDPSVYCVDRPVEYTPNQLDPNKAIFYQCCSYQGASGSPCFSLHKDELYAMHSGGRNADPTDMQQGAVTNIEYGVLLWEVLQDVALQVATQVSPVVDLAGLYGLFPQIRP